MTARRHLSGGWRGGETAFVPEPALAARLSGVRNMEVTLGLRAERLDLVEPGAPGAFAAELTSSEYLGGERLLHFLVDGHRVAVAHTGAAPAVGAVVGVRPRSADVLLFDVNTGLRIDDR